MAANLRTGNLSGGAPDFAAGHQDVKQVGQRVSVTLMLYYQCCGSGIRCLFDPWIRDPE
jgi:hypothetical protein